MIGFANSIVQATLCFASIALLRTAVLYLDARVNAIFMGIPIIMFPLMAIQGWYGPPITPAQTVGSIGSMTAVTGALWALRGCGAPSALWGLAIVASSWLAIILAIYFTGLQAELMAAIIVANGALIFTLYRDGRPVVSSTKSGITDGLIPILVFLIGFFAVAQLIPDFLRGVFVSFRIALFSTIYFARSVLSPGSFMSFVVYTQGAITAGSMFVILLHFTISKMPVALSLATALAGSLLTSALAIGIWRTPRPPP